MKYISYILLLCGTLIFLGCPPSDSLNSEIPHYKLSFLLLNPIINNSELKDNLNLPKDIIDLCSPFTNNNCDSASFYCRPLANIIRIDTKNKIIQELNKESTFIANPKQDSINFMNYLKDNIFLSKQWSLEGDSSKNKLTILHEYLQSHPDASILGFKGNEEDMQKLKIHNFTNISELKKIIIIQLCKNPQSEFIILYKPIISAVVPSLDDYLTEITSDDNSNQTKQDHQKLEQDLIEKNKNEPEDWYTLYLLARLQILQYGNSENSKKICTDYIVKSAYEAIKKNEAPKLTFYLDKHKQEAFKELFEEESMLRAIIEGTRIGLEKNDAAYVGTPINFMFPNNKKVNTVNIDPDKIYIHIGNEIPDKFRISIKDYQSDKGTFKLNLSYPQSNGQDDSYEESFEKHASHTFPLAGKTFDMSIINQTEVGKPYATLGIVKVKKKMTLEGAEDKPRSQSIVIPKDDQNTAVQSTIIEEVNSDFDGDKIPDKIDECPHRNAHTKDGCPKIEINVPLTIYENTKFDPQLIFDSKTNDQFDWSSEMEIIGKNSKNPSVYSKECGKMTLIVNIANQGDNYSSSFRKDVYVKIENEKLAKEFMNIANFGNYALLGKTITSNIKKDSDASEAKISRIVVHNNIDMVKNGKIPTKLDALIRELKSAKRSQQIINFSIDTIFYDENSGKISSVIYSMQ